MTSLQYPSNAVVGGPRIFDVALSAWRAITPRQLEAAFLFGCSATVFHVIIWSWGMLARPNIIDPLIATFVNDQLGAFSLMLAIVVADGVAADRPGSRLPYVVAVIVSAVVSTPLESIFGSLVVEAVFRWKDVVQNGLYFFFDWLVLAGTATFVYVDRRRARGALARMHAAQMERAHSARQTLESRLQAMQARVEPQFLFNTLARVRDLYRKDSQRGERTLDELIAYLRAAMPRMRDTSSTVGQELDLARAYLGIERLRVGERLVVDVESEAGIADARMPPMMLLPLVDHALAQCDPDSSGSTALRIRATAVGDKVRVALQCTEQGVRTSEDHDLFGLRERLAAIYGSEATLAVHVQDNVTHETTLELPLETRSR